jgi:hypothetical protein
MYEQTIIDLITLDRIYSIIELYNKQKEILEEAKFVMEHRQKS